jgi:hypothetical protein
MKLDAWALRDAAARRDSRTILEIFFGVYPRLADWDATCRLADEQWQFIVVPFDPPGVMRLAMPHGSYGWNGYDYFTDYRRSGRPIIRFAPDFCSPHPTYLK